MRLTQFQFWLAITLVLAGTNGAHADDADKACEVTALSTDNDPNGFNVRSGPHAYSPVIAQLPPPIAADGYEFAAEVFITGSTNGWFRIARALLEDYTSDEPAKLVFEGEGWVSGSLLGVSVEGQYLRTAPSPDAATVIDFHKGFADNEPESGPDYFTLERLHACDGRWIEVEGTYRDQRLRGWTDDTCTNQVTTCP